LRVHAILADLIIESRACIIQSSKYGARISENLDAPKLIVEVNPKSKPRKWEKILNRAVVNNYIKKFSVDRSSAKKMAKEHILNMRKLLTVRSLNPTRVVDLTPPPDST